MTEKEYIRLSNLTRIRTMLTILRELSDCPEIPQGAKNQTEQALMIWRDKLQGKIFTSEKHVKQ